MRRTGEKGPNKQPIRSLLTLREVSHCVICLSGEVPKSCAQSRGIVLKCYEDLARGIHFILNKVWKARKTLGNHKGFR